MVAKVRVSRAKKSAQKAKVVWPATGTSSIKEAFTKDPDVVRAIGQAAAAEVQVDVLETIEFHYENLRDEVTRFLSKKGSMPATSYRANAKVQSTESLNLKVRSPIGPVSVPVVFTKLTHRYGRLSPPSDRYWYKTGRLARAVSASMRHMKVKPGAKIQVLPAKGKGMALIRLSFDFKAPAQPLGTLITKSFTSGIAVPTVRFAGGSPKPHTVGAIAYNEAVAGAKNGSRPFLARVSAALGRQFIKDLNA